MSQGDDVVNETNSNECLRSILLEMYYFKVWTYNDSCLEIEHICIGVQNYYAGSKKYRKLGQTETSEKSRKCP